VEIVLNKHNRRYTPLEMVVGKVVFDCKNKLAHKGITLAMEGIVLMEVASGVKKAFTFPKPTIISAWKNELAQPGTLLAGKTEFPFEFKVEALAGQQIHETYHGSCVHIRYIIKCLCLRGFAQSNISQEAEIMTEVKSLEEFPAAREIPFALTSDVQPKTGLKQTVTFSGKLQTTTCSITQPVQGEFVVENCSVPIENICVQLMRVETCTNATGYFREVSEVGSWELADGDIPSMFPLMIFLIMPRLYTCPTIHCALFKIEFELNILVKLKNVDTPLSHTLPLLVVRQ